MKLRLTILTLAAGLALSPLCQAAKRERAEETHESDSDDSHPARPMQRARVEPEAASSSAAASSADATAAFSRPTTSRNIVSMLRSRETTGRMTIPLKRLLAHRCKQLGNAIAAGADQEIKDELKYQIDCLIFSIQTPTEDALDSARSALTGKTLAEARAAFALLPDADEFTKMAYRFVWWQQHPTDENLDAAVNVKEVFAEFFRADFIGRPLYRIDFTPLQQLQNANQLTQVLIDLVLCNPDQQKLDISGVPANCSLTITSTALTWLYANNNADLTALDLSNCPALTRLYASNNQSLTAIDLSNCPALTRLYANNNQSLTTLALSNCPALTTLWAEKNPGLTALALSNNPALTTLAASNNPALTALDLSNCPALTTLGAEKNPGLTALDLSNNPALTDLYAYSNPGLTDFRIAPAAAVAPATIADINAMVAANRARLGLPDAGHAGAGADDAEDDE
ncbi:leucine-rich repeat domain-containing protein [Candidatus Dependentiae bacterium]|nr:leucine-rich repeat domain-containing protein [Candidatus Dependentiae bacterium]